MNKRWVIYGGIALAAFAAALGLTRISQCSVSRSSPLCTLGEGKHLASELGLNARQADEMRRLERTLAAKLSEQCGQYCAIRVRLGDVLMSQDTNSVAEAKRLVDEMCALQSASEMATLEHIQQVCVVLDPAQRKIFLEGLTKCLCGEGGLCAGGCMKESKP